MYEDVFNNQSLICHNDTTSVSVYGQADNNKTDHSKKHRKDLKQLVWSMSVSSDHAFPLFQQAYSGNTADVSTYVEQWHNLIDLLDQRDFLYVGDSKLICHESMAHIHSNDGFFLAPAPMYESYKTAFEKALDDHSSEFLIAYKDHFNRGFEVPITFDYQGKVYTLRMVILFDHGLCSRKKRTLQNRIDKTRKAFSELDSKLNRYKLKTEQNIEKACSAILKANHTQSFRKAKGPLSIEPIYLHTPERIEAFLLLFKIALQMVVLIERTARKNINERDCGLDGFMPNKSDVRNPKSEYMLKAFEDIVKGQIPLPNADTYGFVSELSPLQRDILSILEVLHECYDYRQLIDSS